MITTLRHLRHLRHLRRHGGRQRWRRPRPWLVLCLAPLLGIACDRGRSQENAPDRLVPSVEATEARHGTLPLSQRLSGRVRARNQVEVYSEISAVVAEVLVENGDPVRQGQPLVRLRDAEYRERLKQAQASHRIAVAQLSRAEAQSREARSDLERYRSLAEKSLASRADLDAAEARGETADADVELAKARVEQALASVEEQDGSLARTVIRAPIPGHVGSRDAEVGMLVTPGTRLFTLGQLDRMRVEIVLTDRMLRYIAEGQRAEVSTATGSVSAPVARISPFLNPVTHSTEAEIDVPNPDGALSPGMFVVVDVFYGESEEATLVPLSALHELASTGVLGVYVSRAPLEREPVHEPGTSRSGFLTDPVTFEYVPVELIAQGGMEAAVRGVEAGAWVVTLGQNLLDPERATARVRPVPWERVERLQRLQREDLMQEVIEREGSRDST